MHKWFKFHNVHLEIHEYLNLLQNLTTLKKIFLLVATFFAALTSQAEGLIEATDIDDLALIYIGSQHRPHWGKEQFEPYVMHTYADGKKSWMFDGFLMIEFTAWNKNGIPVNFGESNAQGAQKEDWEWLLDRQLGISTGEGCKALDELIGELIPTLGVPGHKHKVVLTMPSAITSLGAAWGSINGRQLNLTNAADRQRAHEWFIDLLLKKWKECNFKNIELDGVYWVKEAFDDQYVSTVKAANKYVHAKGLKVYWIPYLTAWGRERWREADIDVAYIQPNYYFKEEYPRDRLDKAINEVWNDLFSGIEMEFEGYNYSWSVGMLDAQKYSTDNNGLYSEHPNFYQRLVDYIDDFEQEQIFECFPIAYYSGFQAVYDFCKSGHPKDAEIMHRLAKLINKRHVFTGFDKEPSAGIYDITIGDQTIAYPVEGGIYIAYRQASNVDIYTIDGKQIYCGSNTGASPDAEGFILPCAKGIYVVRVGDKSVKVAVL